MALAKFAKTCAKNTPGNSKVFLGQVADIVSVTLTAGEVSAVSMTGGTAKLGQFGADTDTIQYTHEGKGGTTYAMTYNMVMKFSKKTKTLVAAVETLRAAIPCGIVAVRQDANGQCFLSGWNDIDKGGRPYNTLTDSFDSGSKPDDEGANSYTVTLTGMSGYDEIPFDSTLTTAIVGGSAAFLDYN